MPARLTIRKLEAMVEDLRKRIERLEHAAVIRRPVGFQPPVDELHEYEGTVGGEYLRQEEDME